MLQSPAPAGLKIRVSTVSENHFHARQAAAALLETTTSDQKVVTGLVEAAAQLKDQAGELPPLVTSRAPDVQAEGNGPRPDKSG